MDLQYGVDWVPQVFEEDSDPFASSELEGRNEVAVPGDNHEGGDHISKGEACDIETNSQVNALLLNVGDEVPCGEGSVCLHETLGGLAPELPPVDRGFAPAKREVGLHFEP